MKEVQCFMRVQDRRRLGLIIYPSHPSLDEVSVIQRCEWCRISGGLLLDFFC